MRITIEAQWKPWNITEGAELKLAGYSAFVTNRGDYWAWRVSKDDAVHSHAWGTADNEADAKVQAERTLRLKLFDVFNIVGPDSNPQPSRWSEQP